MPRHRRSLQIAYLLWLFGLGGLLGLHRFYLGDARKGILELVTLGGLGALAARDLLSMERLVDRANGIERREGPRPWKGDTRRARWTPVTMRGRIVAAAFALSVVLTAMAGWRIALVVLLVWASGWWTFSVGVFLAGLLLPAYTRVLRRVHHIASGRSPGDPRGVLEARARSSVRVDAVPDEAFLPLAAAIAVAFELARWGPALPLVGEFVGIGLPLVPLVAGLLFPLLRAPPATRYATARYDERDELASLRPLGARLSVYFSLLFLGGALLQAWAQRDAGLFTLVFSLVVPVLLGTAWYEKDRLARDACRVERVLGNAGAPARNA